MYGRLIGLIKTSVLYHAQKAPHFIQYFPDFAALIHAIIVVGILIDGLYGLFDVAQPA
jgi:hypothetical protein